MDEKRFRFDLAIAVAALLISGVAAGASAYQTYVIRQQFSATVWPYLTFVSSSSQDNFVELDLNNPGIGPALIRTVVITRDGNPVMRSPGNVEPALEVAIGPEQAAAKADESKSGSRSRSSMTVASIERGDVLPAGGSVKLLRIDGKFFTRRAIADSRRVDIDVCYCSLLGTCWTKRLWDQTVEPHPVSSCPAA